MHKGCSCAACLRGKRTDAGHASQRAAEHKLRRASKKQLDAVVKHGAEPDEVIILPIGSQYTD